MLLFIVSNTNFKSYKQDLDKINKLAHIKTYNQNICIIIDYSLHSSINRGIVFDLKTNKKLLTFKVAHGKGKYFSLQTSFSNIVGSNKSSLGMAVIQEKTSSSWGIGFNYRIRGLEKTNSNIYKRNIVLHSWSGIFRYSIFPIPLAQSQGCPTVSNKDMLVIDNIIKTQKNKNILIYFKE